MAIARVQQNSSSTVGPTSAITLSYGVTPINGDFLVLGVWVSSTVNGTISTIVQTGVTWTKAIQFTNGGEDTEIWYARNVLSAGTSVTVNFSSPVTDTQVFILEYSGLPSSTTLDQVASNSGQGTTVDSGTTPLTLINNELWVGVIGGGVDLATPTLSLPSNGFVQVAQAGTINNASALEEKIVTGTNPANVSAAISNGTADWSGVIATFGNPVTCPVFMSAADLINELRDRFAEIAFTSWISDLDLIRWMNLGLDDIVMRTLPPRNEKAPLLIPVTPGVYTYPIPSDWFRNKQFGDSGGFYVIGPNYFNVLLEEDRTDDLEEDLAAGLNSNNNIPNNFWIWNEQFYIYPIPDIAYTLKLYYYRLPVYVCVTTDPVDIDRPWVETLIKFILWKALEKDKHPMASYYRSEYEQGLSNMYSESRVKVEKRARYVHSHGYYGTERW